MGQGGVYCVMQISSEPSIGILSNSTPVNIAVVARPNAALVLNLCYQVVDPVTVRILDVANSLSPLPTAFTARPSRLSEFASMSFTSRVAVPKIATGMVLSFGPG